jgi:O-succinylbenzoate synthase
VARKRILASPTLEIFEVELPLLAPFRTSLEVEEGRSALILAYKSKDITAYSECVTFENPYYGSEDNATAIHLIKDHLAKVLIAEPTPEEFVEPVAQIRGHNMAKAAVEMLMWDFHCKVKNESIAKSLGDSKGYAEVGISLGMDRSELLVKNIEEALSKGYRRIKIKIKRGIEHDLIKSVRDSYPDIPLSADANGDYNLKDVDALKRLDKFGLLYIEQPLDYDDLLDHAKLAKVISTPICLDESITTPKRAKQAFEIGAAEIINIKPGRLGGLSNSLEVAKIARDNGGHVWVGGMLETGVGRSFNIAFAALKLVDLPGDTSPNEAYFARDIVSNPFKMEKNGTIAANSGPGVGVELDSEFFRSSVRKSWKIIF